MARSVLKQRSLTAIVFAAIVFSMVLSGKLGSIFLLSVIAVLAGHEYLRMVIPYASKRYWVSWIPFLLTFNLVFVFGVHDLVFSFLIYINVIVFLLFILHLYIPFLNHKKYFWAIQHLYITLPIVLFIQFLWIRDDVSSVIMLWILFLIWTSDSFAYLVGSKKGKTKLFESISPKKSWEGFVGGGVFAVIVSILLYFIVGLFTLNIWILLALICWTLGTYGDLFESSIKRNFNVKDSGKLMPGHGGILDRFDSFIFVLPFVLLLIKDLF